jgi:alkylated DNA nucleotide flippase Atl1
MRSSARAIRRELDAAVRDAEGARLKRASWGSLELVVARAVKESVRCLLVSGARNSFQLFSIGSTIAGSPALVRPATFSSLHAREVQEIERWLKEEPAVMGEPLKIVARQFAGFDRTLDRLDLLALDQKGKLVVVEIKRDDSSSSQDLQALRYAAYCSALTAEQVVDLYRTYERAERGHELAATEARRDLEDFIGGDSLDALDEDDCPRMILVATGFPVGVTNTALWLRRNSDLDITCVQVQPYEINGEIVLASTVLIPLPEAEEYQSRLKEKERKARHRREGGSLDFDVVRAFIASIPRGRWSSYGDVAAAAGAPKGAQAVGTWLSRNEEDVPPLVYRVLNRDGEVSDGWRGSGDLPSTPDEVRAKLADEGVIFDGLRARQDQRWTPEDWVASQEATIGS